MKTFSAILCVIIATFGSPTIASPVNLVSKIVTANICCPPDRFSARMISTNTTVNGQGTTTIIQGDYKINTDYSKQVIAVNGFMNSGGDKSNLHLIIHPNMSYVIDDTKKTCEVSRSIPYTPKTCMPDTVTAMGPVFYGKLGTKAYSVNTKGYSMFVTMTDLCLPINLMETKTSNGLTVVTSALYTDLSTKVDDKAFIPPPFCPHP